MPPLTRPAAVLFDMDGTLTLPVLDFERIRREMGIAAGEPILEALRRMPADRRGDAEAVLLRHEAHAAETAALAGGCHEILGLLERSRTPAAIVTRNSLASTHTVLMRGGMRFGALVTREDEPHKPSPEPLWLGLKRLGIGPTGQDVWMIGDGEHDIASANAAGVRAIWVSHGKRRGFAAQPCQEVESLWDVHELLASLL
jgi:phosphoglycolate phosphatase-like HAD superfamily hydrolase